MTRAVFLDRDGVLVREHGHVASPDGLALLPGVVAALRELGARGFARIVCTNQSGVARRLLDFDALGAVHARLRELCDGELDAIYVCPHHPSEGASALTRACQCRKPGPALFERAIAEFALDARACAGVGDSPRDVEAAARAGVASYLVLGPKVPSAGAYRGATAPKGFVQTLADLPARLDAASG